MSFANVIGRAGAGVLVSAFLMFGLIAPNAASAASCSNGGEYSTNDVIFCGAFTKADLQNKIDNGDGVNSAASIQNIFFTTGHITMAEIMSNDTVAGRVDQNGNVYVTQDVIENGQVVFKAGSLVATNAWSVGRTKNADSVAFGPDAWKRPVNNLSFISASINGWINMSGGQFHFFILSVCGNFGGGTPIAHPTPKPSPSPSPKPSPSPTPSMTPKPTPSCTPSATPVAVASESPTPTPTPTQTPGQVLGVSTNLPQTGPEDLMGGAAGLTAIGYAGRAYLRSRKSFIDSFKKKIDKK
jgi:hypothetical protein